MLGKMRWMENLSLDEPMAVVNCQDGLPEPVNSGDDVAETATISIKPDRIKQDAIPNERLPSGRVPSGRED